MASLSSIANVQLKHFIETAIALCKVKSVSSFLFFLACLKLLTGFAPPLR